MSRRFITLISAAAIALSGLSFSASTARADDRKTAQWIAGIAAAAIVGAVIIDQKKDRERRKREAVQRQRYYDQYGHGHYRNDQRRAHKYHEKQRKERIKRHRKAHKHDHKHGHKHGHAMVTAMAMPMAISISTAISIATVRAPATTAMIIRTWPGLCRDRCATASTPSKIWAPA